MLIWKRVKLPERREKMRRLKNVPWVILLLAAFVAGSTMESHARIQSTPTSTSELHRQLDLFGEVLQRVRSDYVEKPNDAKLIEAAINGMSAPDPHSGYLDPKLQSIALRHDLKFLQLPFATAG